MVAALAASGCGSGGGSVEVRYASLRQAAAVISHHCTRDLTSSNSNGLLWVSGGRHPLVYYASAVGDPPNEVLTTGGPAIRPWGLLWPCSPPVAIHYPNTHTAARSSTALLTVLASKPSERRTITLGQVRFANPENWNSESGYANGLIAPNGKVIFFSGTKVRYADGPEFSVHGLEQGWQIGALAVSPRNPFVFLATAERGELGGQPCATTIYRITRTSSASLESFDGCLTGVTVQWSPDGKHIAWFQSPDGDATNLLLSDADGAHRHKLAAHILGGAVWSPDSTSIGYGVEGRARSHWTYVVNVSTGARHLVGRGYPLAWSPDGEEIALIRQSQVIPSSAGSIVAVPAAGGRAHFLLEVPPAPTR